MQHWLEAIYRQHRTGLIGLARSVARQDDAAEDAVHEAFTRLASKDAEPQGDAVAYVYRAVRNAAVDQIRRRAAGVQPTTDGEQAALFADPGPSAHDRLEQTELHRLLTRALETLDDPIRETIVMKCFGNLTFQQIAQARGEPLSTVASRYQRGLKQLKGQLEINHEPIQS